MCTYHLLVGSILSVWGTVENVFDVYNAQSADTTRGQQTMRIARVAIDSTSAGSNSNSSSNSSSSSALADTTEDQTISNRELIVGLYIPNALATSVLKALETNRTTSNVG